MAGRPRFLVVEKPDPTRDPSWGRGALGGGPRPCSLLATPGLPREGVFKLQPQLGCSVVVPLPFSSLMDLIPHEVQIFRTYWLR